MLIVDTVVSGAMHSTYHGKELQHKQRTISVLARVSSVIATAPARVRATTFSSKPITARPSNDTTKLRQVIRYKILHDKSRAIARKLRDAACFW